MNNNEQPLDAAALDLSLTRDAFISDLTYGVYKAEVATLIAQARAAQPAQADERELFEAWIRNEEDYDFDPEIDSFDRDQDGKYKDMRWLNAWEVWEARARIANRSTAPNCIERACEILGSFPKLDLGAAQAHHAAATTGEDARWMPIEHAPTDGTELLLTHWTPENGYGHVDFGCWGFIENSDYDDRPIYGWLSNYGDIEEPTHFMRVSAPNAIQKEGGQ